MNSKDFTNIRIIPTNKTQNYLIKILKRSSKWAYIGQKLYYYWPFSIKAQNGLKLKEKQYFV